jgi:enamine deaminase RidA (YjgF/YER057c/UK114 family)
MGDLIFVAGQLARDGSGKLAAHGVKAETQYIIQHRLVPALQAAGSDLDLVLKAQAYVSEPQVFQDAWKQAFPTTVVPVRLPAFLTREATVEINVIAAHRSARARIRDLKGKARMLDGLIFAGGLSTLEEAGEIFDLSRVVRGLFFHAKGAAPADPGFPYSAIEVASGFTIDLWGYAP